MIRQTYDSAGRPSKLALPNGLAADITFEAQTSRVATIRYSAGALAELGATKTCSHDQIERLTAVARPAANATGSLGERYSYDGSLTIMVTPHEPAIATLKPRVRA